MGGRVMNTARSDRREDYVPGPTASHRVPDAVSVPFHTTIHRDPDRCSACAAVSGACWCHTIPQEDWPADAELDAWVARYGEAA